MLYFPQLATGATSQYPIQRKRAARTVLNKCLDGSAVKWADAAGAVTSWELHFEELSDEELATLEQFFLAAEGTLNPFTFLDPAGNLLCWSEDLTQPAWQKDPLLTASSGVTDVWGTQGAFLLQNGSAGALRLAQSLEAPASYCYTLSLYARSDRAGQVRLLKGADALACRVATNWRRLYFSGDSQSAAANLAFGVELDAGTTVEVCGLQVEAQPGASTYQKSDGNGGIYTGARLGSDSLEITTQGPNRHACVLRVMHADHI
jgi:hypothetical protein